MQFNPLRALVDLCTWAWSTLCYLLLVTCTASDTICDALGTAWASVLILGLALLGSTGPLCLAGPTMTSSIGRDPFQPTQNRDQFSTWIQERQRDFADFDRSIGFSGRPVTDFDTSDLFSPIPPRFAIASDTRPISPPSPYSPRPEQTAIVNHSNMSQDSTELSPKAKVSYDQDKFQVEFNVQDYKPEELSIKTEGDILIVLAKHETKTENGQSFVSKQFEQRFSLPSGVQPEKITSSLSKDGFLTVTAPRESAAKKIENKNSGQVYSQSKETKEAEGLPHPKVKYDDDKFQISLDAHDYKPEELDVKVEGNTIIITAKQEIAEAGGTRTRVFEQKFSLPSGVKGDKVSSSLNKDGVLVITAPRGNAAASYSTQTIESKMDKVLSPSSWEDDMRRDSAAFKDDIRRDSSALNTNSIVNNSRHGSIFDNGRNNSIFDDRAASIFDRSERSGSLFDRDNTAMFAGNSEQSGISRVEYTDDTYKILVNVANYKPEELVIKTIGNTVNVEAKHEEKTSDGHSFSTKSFQQSFTLPRGVNPEAVSSSLSKDGTLTIAAPLPPSLKQVSNERLVPIKHN